MTGQHIIKWNLFTSLKVFSKYCCNYSAQITHSSFISTATLSSHFCMEIPSRMNPAPCWPEHNPLTATAACSNKGWSSRPTDRWVMTTQNNSSIKRQQRILSLSLDSLGPTPLSQRICCQLLRQTASNCMLLLWKLHRLSLRVCWSAQNSNSCGSVSRLAF